MQENERGLSDREIVEDLNFWVALILLSVPDKQQPKVFEDYLDGKTLAYAL